HRRHGRRAGALPEHGERARRGDRGQLSGAHPALRADRELRGRRPASRRPRRAARLHVSRPRAELLDPLGQGPLRSVGPVRWRRRASGEVRPEPGDAAIPRAAIEDHVPARAPRRGQRADSGRRRHPVATRALGRGRRARRRAGQDLGRAGPRRLRRGGGCGHAEARRRSHRRRARAAHLMRALRIGIDIGGTFTDAALVDGETGAIRVVKVLTTPEDPSQGFMAALERGLAECQATGRDVAAVVHATTVATNAIIEGKTARVGMLVTRGFRDILEIGRQILCRLFDVLLQKPAPLVPRRFSLELGERLDHEGNVLQPLDLNDVRQAGRQLHREGVEAVVVCLLHSYLNPAHERAVAAILREELPSAFLSVSSEVCPEFREYLRASTTAVNAAVMPIVSRYVDALESRLRTLGAVAPFYVMQSNGGVMTSASAKARPVYMVESGPAAGVIAAGAIAAPYGYRNVMSFDMGGTTAKVGLIQDGQLRLSTEIEVGAQSVTPLGEGRGGGYPIRTPVIDLVEVGAGG